MSQQIPQKPHLWEDDLSEEADRERKNLADWASSIQGRFKRMADDFEVHESDELHKKISPLLWQLGLRAKVRLFPCVTQMTAC